MPQQHDDLVPVRRALLSVSDKTGLADFARALHEEFRVELISTGGTAKFLRDAGLPVIDVSEITGFPEMMDGRVKTLHPKIHGGLLALRDHSDHVASMKQHDIQPIDLVCINLYPFAETIAKPDVTFEEAIENIDIGGPSMIRSAAKNHRWVLVVTSADRYEKVLGDLRQHGGASCGKHRLKMAQRAFAHTAEYDATIAEYLAQQIDPGPPMSARTGGAPSRFSGAPHEGTIALATDELRPGRGGRGNLPQIMLDRLHRADTDLPSFLKALLEVQGVTIAGTEAAAFLVEPGGNEFELRPVAHVRPDDASPRLRAAALAAFAEIVRPCVQQGKGGAIEVDSTKKGTAGPQFCLVTLLRSDDEVVAVTAVIARAANLAGAKRLLGSMELVAGYFEMWNLRKTRNETPDETSDLFDDQAAAAQRIDATLPKKLELKLMKKQDLRYGENPHQRAALYVGNQPDESSIAFAEQLHGKELSYINLLDADASLLCVQEFDAPAACIVKHATPCGVAAAIDPSAAFLRAYESDPLAAFGGIVAFNREVDLPTAQAITSIDKLLEVIVATAFTDDALALLRERWKNARLLATTKIKELRPLLKGDVALLLRSIDGGYLVQERDSVGVVGAEWKTVSRREPTARELDDLKLAWLACKHVKSNAIVIAKDRATVGIGGGQVDRVGAARIAIEKAAGRASGSVAASDAFFPFPDGPKLLIDAGITAIVQPGGSVRDAETIGVADAAGVAMVFTGRRHFRH